MSARRSPWIELLVLAAVVGLGFVRSADLREMARFAEASRSLIRSDADLLRSPGVLGPEAPLLDALQREHPPGTPVSVQGHGDFVARAQRFWLALLPAYPIRGHAALRVCPHPCDEPGDRVLARGAEFVLLERGGRR